MTDAADTIANAYGVRARVAAIAEGIDAPFGLDRFRRPAWHQWAACRGAGNEAFFANEFTEARRICAGCPVAGTCLTDALTDITREGCWAGTSPKQRRAMRAGTLSVSGWLEQLAPTESSGVAA